MLARHAFRTKTSIPVEDIRKYLQFKLGLLANREVVHQSEPSDLYEMILRSKGSTEAFTSSAMLCNQGAICASSGKNTGRIPKEKRTVVTPPLTDDIWWGDVNIKISEAGYYVNYRTAIDYLNTRQRLYVMDGYIGWDPEYRIKVRVVCERGYHALFMRNMMVRPTHEELMTDFVKGVDFDIVNAGAFPANPATDGVTSRTSVNVNLKDGKMVILGTQYAGEMKKGMFGVMHYLMPKKGVLTLHSSANEGPKGDTTLLFGLSGTGKTTLSTDPRRKLIGDDEHAWTDHGIFNLEGGCYAKAVDLSREKEPEIYDAIRYGSILENIKFFEGTRDVNYADTSKTLNTRLCYPLEFIPNVKLPAMGGHPKTVIFLTCDAYGILPPVSKLTPEQAMYHFISGYTAKVAGTEMGIEEPTPSFSACFGEAFLPLHPNVYAELLGKKLKKHGSTCWLINTGWSGGMYGEGERMSLKITRKIIDEIHAGNLDLCETTTMDIFGLPIPKHVDGIDPNILNPRNTWADKENYDLQLKKLASKFIDNFKYFEEGTSQKIIDAGPKL